MVRPVSPASRNQSAEEPPAATDEDLRLAVIAAKAAAGEPLGDLDASGLVFGAGDLESDRPLDFEGGELRGCTFTNLDLSEARFMRADLSGCSFHNVNLMGADFSGSACRGAVFTDVNLAYAAFADSDLCGALFFRANLADISFKGASVDGAEVDAVRLSLNGGTQVLGLKEALRALAGESSYPYIAAVSGDAFWLSYFLRTRHLKWGGFAKDVLRRGLENFGFACSFLDEPVEADAWEALMAALANGSTIITPLQIPAATMLGGGLGGAEWVFVTGIDRGDLLVNCLLGDRLRMSPEQFRAGWCGHHPKEVGVEDIPVVYAMCLVGARESVPSRVEISRSALAGAVEVMTLPSTERVLFGFDAYQQMVEDLQSARGPRNLPVDEARRFLPWLGLGVLHHHGSRWAIRDFLDEVLDRGDFTGADRTAMIEAHELYEGACSDLKRFLELMPWSFDEPDLTERLQAAEAFERHREQGVDLLRAAAARERDALERFQAVIRPH